MSRSARELLLGVGLCVLAAVLLLVAAGRPWAEVVVPRAGLPAVRASVPGRDLAPVVVAAGLLGLAGAAAMLATRRWGRLAVALVLLVAGLGVVLGVRMHPRGAAQHWAAERFGQSATAPSVSTTAWPTVAVAAGVLLALAGSLAAVRGHRWAGMSPRYERSAGASGVSRAQAGSTQGNLTTWEALDRGEDPTDAPS